MHKSSKKSLSHLHFSRIETPSQTQGPSLLQRPICKHLVAIAVLLSTSLAMGAEIPPSAYKMIALPEDVQSEVLYAKVLQESVTSLRD